MKHACITAMASLALLFTSAVAQSQPNDDDADDSADAQGASEAKGATPAASAAGAPADDAEADVESLRQEYLRLRDLLFQSRARAATVASAVYSTRVRIHLRYTTARFYTVTRATIRLDGANVFDDADATIGKDEAPRFEGYVAPGRHQLTIRIEAVGNDDERFTSVIENTFTIQAPAGKDVIIDARAKDGGDMPYRWQRKEKGNYRLHLDVDVDTSARKNEPTARTGQEKGGRRAARVATHRR